MPEMPTCFVDLDGTLFDFDKKCRDVFHMGADEAQATLGNSRFWKIIRDWRNSKGQGFYRSLDWMPDGEQLWNGVKHLKPTILTGCPIGNWAAPQKVDSCAEKLGADVPVITCMARSKVKHLERPGDVLVDDKTKYQHVWEEGGGIFVHHTSAATSLARLREIYPIWFERTDFWTPPRG